MDSLANRRTRNVRWNVLFSALLKAVSVLCSLVIVPITLDYLDKETYGIWMTLSSMLMWVAFFDLGFGNGMRNYLTQAISEGDFGKGRRIVSTAFLFLTAVAVFCAIVCLLVIPWIDMNALFNTTAMSSDALMTVVAVAMALTLVTFVLKNIGFIFVALQKYALHDVLTVGGSVLGVLLVYLLTKTTEGHLLYVVLAFTAAPVIVYLLSAIPVFSVYSSLRPSLRSIDMEFGKRIVNKGLGFFVIQITSCLVVFGSANLFIAHFCGPEEVTVYNIAYRYFNLIAIAYTIVISPMWNAYTDAYVKGDMPWIDRTFKRAMIIWGLSVAGGIAMLLISPYVYQFWVKEKVEVPMEISVATLLYICCFNLNNCVTYLLNGLNKIRVQILTSVVGTSLFLVAVWMVGSPAGSVGIIICMAVCYAAMAIVHLWQCRLLIKCRAKGIWNK